MARLVAACVLLVFSLLCHDVAAEERAAVIVRIANARLAAVAERIRGQVSDLPIDLRTAAVTELEASADQRTRAALELGRAQKAIAVVWLEPQSDGALLVCIAALASGDVLARRLDPLPRNNESAISERLETAAVVVRATLEALLETGKPRPPAEPPQLANEPSSGGQERGGETTPNVTLRVTKVRRASAETSPPTTRVRVALGWLAAIDGRTSWGSQGPLARVDVLWRRLGFGLSGTGSLPGTIHDGLVRLRLVRVSATADAFLTFPIGRVFAVEGHAGAGVVVFHRSTIERPAAGAFATPSRSSFSPEFTADAVLAFTPHPALRSLRLFMSAGAAFVLSPPRFDSMSEQGIVRGPALWMLEPRFTAGLGWAF